MKASGLSSVISPVKLMDIKEQFCNIPGIFKKVYINEEQGEVGYLCPWHYSYHFLAGTFPEHPSLPYHSYVVEKK